MSTLSKFGNKGDINETIELSKNHKLVNPHSRRTAAFTQTTKSSMKKTMGRSNSTHSQNKDKDV